MHITYEIKLWPFYVDNGSLLRNSLLGHAKISKNPNPDKLSYSGYCISFDIHETFSLPNGGFGKNVIIFSTDWAHLCILVIKKQYLISQKRPNAKARQYYVYCRNWTFY